MMRPHFSLIPNSHEVWNPHKTIMYKGYLLKNLATRELHKLKDRIHKQNPYHATPLKLFISPPPMNNYLASTI